ncbi:LuxR C-terminal-related transcriptional regulator [Leucobacter musarum]|uniref:LuxR C-terminal-related transcriptional regulator n=1 Tax=Leucobacter musarum TaxID=1930747 RepID=UPI0006A76D62|nr:LuxR C-terminal-related transcriptional regulator [Leucobacter musarum]
MPYTSADASHRDAPRNVAGSTARNAAVDSAHASARNAIQQSPEFPSRADAAARAREQWDAGSPLVVLGEPGSGRTTFADRLLQGRAGGVRRITGVPQLADVPFAALAAVLAGVPGVAGSAESPARLIAALARESVDAASVSGVLVIDDADWIDEASAAVFAQAATDGPVRLVVLGTRLDRLPSPLRAFALDAALVELAPLELDDAAILVERVFGGVVTLHDVDHLRRLGGGNARFVHELARDALENGGLREVHGYLALREEWRPHGRRIGELITLRLAHQPVEVRDAVEMLAVTGEISLTLAEDLVAPADLDAGLALGLIEMSLVSTADGVGRDEVVRISGGLTPQTLLAQLPQRRLQQHAGRALEHAQRLHPASRLTVGLHAMRAGVRLDADVREALAIQSLAARQFEVTIALTERLDADPLPDPLRRLRAHALFETGRHDEALTLLAPLLQAADPEARAQAATMLSALGRSDQADELLQPAPGDDPHWAAELGAHRDVLRARAGVPVPEATLRAHAATASLGRDTRAAALQTALFAAVHGGRAGDTAGEIVALMVSPAWQDIPVSEQGNLLITYFMAARALGSNAQLDIGLSDDDWATLQIPPGLYLGAEGVQRLERGDAMAARELLWQALAVLGDDNRFGITAYFAAAGAAACAHLGDRAHAEQLRAAATAALRVGGTLQSEAERMLLAADLLLDGNSHATDRWRHQLARAHEHEEWYVVLRLLHDGWRWGLHDDLDALHDAATRVQGPLADALGEYARAIGGDDAALTRALQSHLALDQHLFAGECAMAAVRAARADRRGRPSNASIEPAILGLSELTGVDTPVLGRVRIDAELLSAREHEVCLLAHAGSSSARIAEQLYLSARTVEGHLQRAFAKLGIDSRQQLAPPAERAVAPTT